jgi:SNF2 family DNA or RNA helicase
VTKAFVESGALAVEAGYREREMMKTIPGVQWVNKTSNWKVPLSWASLAALRGTFGPDFEMDEEVIAWAWNERLTRVDPARAARAELAPGQYGFQEVGISFLRAAGSALLGDEMGLGKTRQAILAADLPCLVVCPNSMKYAWRDEWTKWRPNASVAVVDGTPKAKATAISSGADVVVVNWESLRTFSRLAPYGSIRLSDKQREPGALNVEWSTVIADEAHRAKDPTSQQTRALWAIGASAQRRIALSGTPVANSPVDLWSIMHFVEPKEYPSRTAFIDRYCLASINFWGGLDVYALKPHMRPELDSFFEPRFLRRQKSEVLTQLPAKTYSTRLTQMATAQWKAYESLRKDMLAALDDGTILATFDPLVQTLRLLQLASACPVVDADGNVTALKAPSNKLDALQDILSERSGSPTVVFAASRKLIELCSREVKVDHVLITGAQSPAQRADAVARFQEGAVPLALVTLGAGGEGITLTAADTAVFLQRSWSLVQNLQAEDRIHRIGQLGESVNILDVVSANSIEAKVMEALAGKEATLQDVVKDRKILRSLLV